MMATLNSSIGKMHDLLARLSPQASAKPQLIQPQPVRDVVTAAIAASRGKHEIRLLGDCDHWAAADSSGLEQAIGHLLRNAVEASPPHQPVTVRVERVSEEIAISISDTGQGMDSEFIRNRLFQPFASTKASGFGIGAFEAQSLVSAMGGRISVESRPGEGSQFTIHVGAAQAPREEQRKIA
jgi:signal transduction histidine kinase